MKRVFIKEQVKGFIVGLEGRRPVFGERERALSFSGDTATNLCREFDSTQGSDYSTVDWNKDLYSPADRAAMWVRNSLAHFQDGNLVDAELASYEAGRYGLAIPPDISENALLKQQFDKGFRDAIEDTAEAERIQAMPDFRPDFNL